MVWGEGCIVPGEFIVVEFDGRARREDGRVVNMPGFDLVAESDSSMKQCTPVSPKASEAKLRVLEMAEWKLRSWTKLLHMGGVRGYIPNWRVVGQFQGPSEF